MNPLHTPPKSRLLVWAVRILVLASPLAVAAHFSLRSARGDYAWNGDSIGIPIFSYLLLAFPIACLLLRRGLRSYAAGIPLLGWNCKRGGWSLLWTALVLLPLGYFLSLMVLDGIQGEVHVTALYFGALAYLLVVMRASIVQEAGASAALPQARNADAGVVAR